MCFLVSSNHFWFHSSESCTHFVITPNSHFNFLIPIPVLDQPIVNTSTDEDKQLKSSMMNFHYILCTTALQSFDNIIIIRLPKFNDIHQYGVHCFGWRHYAITTRKLPTILVCFNSISKNTVQWALWSCTTWSCYLKAGNLAQSTFCTGGSVLNRDLCGHMYTTIARAFQLSPSNAQAWKDDWGYLECHFCTKIRVP